MINGLWLSFITVFFWAFYDVAVRYMGNRWSIDPLTFTALVNLVAALGLLTVAGRGPLGLHTLKQFHTWVYSFTMVLMDSIFIFVVFYASATETNFLLRTTIVTSAFLCWAALGRRITTWQWPGLLIVLAGVTVVALSLPAQNRAITLFFIGIMVICHTIRTYVSETHPSTDKAELWADKARVTGYVLLVTSLGFLLLSLSAAVAFGGAMASHPMAPFFPTLNDFSDGKSLVVATLLGLLIIAPSNYMYFQAVKKVGADGFLMVAAFLPVFTFGFEYLASTQGWLDIHSLKIDDFIGGALITLGAVWGVSVKILGADFKPSKQEQTYMSQAQGYINATLVHCHQDAQKAAELLKLHPNTLVKLQAGSKIYSPATYIQLKRHFDDNVMSRDSLTGLKNRLAFLTLAQTMLAESQEATLFLIDLNKFKPVNDQYGHAVGDSVLRVIAQRLQMTFGNKAEVTRLGGDEFCLLFSKLTDDASAIKKQIEDLIEQPISIIGVEDKIHVSASIGFAHYQGNDQTPEELLHQADMAMYQHKDAR